MNDLDTFNEELSYADAFCSEYESLLDQCQQALSAWSDRSEKARRDQLSGEALGSASVHSHLQSNLGGNEPAKVAKMLDVGWDAVGVTNVPND